MGDYFTNTSEYSEQNAPSNKPIEQTVQPSQTISPVQVTRPAQIVQPLGKQYVYSNDVFHLDSKDILRRAVKYLFEGLAVAFVAYYVAKGRLDTKDIIILGITAAFVFAILDTFSPTVALGTRFGAGFGIGQGLFGVGPAMLANPLVPVII